MLSEFGPGLSLWAALAVAFLLVAFFAKARFNYLGIPKLPAGASVAAPDCMVVIPARNEESTIARAVSSFPHDTVIVVDDQSGDGTAERARAAGAGVLTAPDVFGKTIGKANACAAGARVLTSRWILFADADTFYEPRFLGSAVACAEASGLDFLSVHLRPACLKWAESVLVPYAAALFFCGVRVRDPAAVFNGQCVLVRRQAYEFIGGHAAVMTHVVDDVKLAGLAERHRLKLGTARANGLGHVQFHPQGLWQGFERNALRFMMVRSPIGAMIVLASASAALWLPALLWLLVDEHRWAASAFALLPSAILGVWYRSPVRALLAPLAIYGMALVIANGVISAMTGRRLEWKGRII